MELRDALAVGPREAVAFIGAGGKTTSLFRLAAELRADDRKVLVTTTTKIFRPAKPHVDRLFLIDDVEALLAGTAQLAAPVIIAVGRSIDGDGKLIGLPGDWIEPMRTSGQFDQILIEADGAASRLFKVPAENEPVVPAATTSVVWIMSIRALGNPIDPEFVHRADRAVSLLGVEPGTPLSVEHVLQLLAHPLGPLKGIPEQSRRVAMLSQADTAEDVGRARALAHRVAGFGFERVVITAFATADPLKEVVSSRRGAHSP
jgi:probable selenium-dependent hydroxylase accessory protein YqeC